MYVSIDFILDFNAYHVAAVNTSADAFIHLGDYVSTQIRKQILLRFV